MARTKQVARRSLQQRKAAGEGVPREEAVRASKPSPETRALRKKFEQIFLAQLDLQKATGKDRKAAKKTFDGLYNPLTEDEKYKYQQYKNVSKDFIEDIQNIEKRQGTTVRVNRKAVPTFEEDAAVKRTERYKEERSKLLETKAKTDEEALIEEAFAEMEKARYTVPIESAVVKTSFYQPQLFGETPWDIPNLTLKERETLSRPEQKKLLKQREGLGAFMRALKEGDEVEIRFGMQKNRFFDSQVTKDGFNNVLKWLETKSKSLVPVTTTTYSKSTKVVDTVYNDKGVPVKDHQGNIVKKTYRDTIRIIDGEDGRRTIESKRGLSTLTSANWGFRLQASRETELPKSEIAKYDLTSRDFTVRQKTRWSVKGNGVTYDLTKVVDPRNRKNIRYEIEIEIDGTDLEIDQVSLLDRVKEQVLFMHSKMQKVEEEDVISPRNLLILISNYNQIFTGMRTGASEPTFLQAGLDSEVPILVEAGIGSVAERQERFNPYSFYNIENKPRAFNFKNVAKGFDYRVTPKLDGERDRIYIDPNGIFAINPRTGYASMIYKGEWKPAEEESVTGTVVDAELYKGEYYPFDVLAYKGRNLIELYFDQRMEKIVKSIKIKEGDKWVIKTVGLAVPGFTYDKPFFGHPGGNVYNAIRQTFEWMDENSDLEYDGLILQRNDEPYWEPFPKVTSTMKWKPLDEITVDLLTKITSDGLVELFSVNPNIKGGNHAGLQKERFVDYVPKYGELDIPEDLTEEGDFIAEYYFEQESPFLRFKMVRTDKTEPNFHAVVKSNRDSFFRNPVSREDLLGGTLKTWRKWASALKRDIVNETIPASMRVLDIGVGRGGGALFDLSRRAAKVYGIDPDKDNLEELRNRLSSSGFTDDQKERIVVAQLKGQDTEKILELVGDERVDVITMFFSISFFYENEKELNALMKTIDRVAKSRRQGAMLVFQLMDGNKIANEMKEMGGNVGKSYTLRNDGDPVVYKVKTRLPEDPNMTGLPVRITLPQEDDAIIGTGEARGVQNEWLASVPVLDRLLAEIGFRKISDDFMDKDAILPESNAQFADLNRSLIYIRGGGPKPIALRSRLTFATVEPDYMSPLPEDETEEFKEYSRIGVKSDSSSFLRSLLYHISKEYRLGDMEARTRKVKQLRKTLGRLVDEEIFESMVSGNVKHNLTYDKLYTKAYDTMEKGEQVDVVFDKTTAPDAAYEEYKRRVREGPVGYEIAEAVGCLWNVRVTIVDESGAIVFVGNPDGKKKQFSILKIGSIGFEPLV